MSQALPTDSILRETNKENKYQELLCPVQGLDSRSGSFVSGVVICLSCAMALRVCFPYNFKRIFEYNKEKDAYEGLLGGIVESVRDYCRRVVNMTLENQADDLGIGVYREELGHYDGCIGELQMNRTDLIVQMFPYPKDIPDVSQGIIWYETSLNIVSMYNKTEVGASSQLLDSFEAFSASVWSLCVVACLFMIMFLVAEQVLLHLARSLQSIRPLISMKFWCTVLATARSVMEVYRGVC